MSYNCQKFWKDYNYLEKTYLDVREEYLRTKNIAPDSRMKSLEKVQGLRDIYKNRNNLKMLLESLSGEFLLIPNFIRQYDSQYSVLKKSGLLKLLPESLSWGIKGIDGREYPIPSKISIIKEILKNREKYELKVKQGFTRLQLTPFALPLREIILALEKSLLKHHKEGKLFAPKVNPTVLDEQLPLDTSNPVRSSDGWWDRENNPYESADELGKIKYYPKMFIANNHGGKTKREILYDQRVKKASVFVGWKVLFLEYDLILKGDGKLKTHGESLYAASYGSPTPIDYLEKLQSDAQYANEQGITNEDWLMLLMNSLEENNHVIDGLLKKCLLLASWNPSLDFVGKGYWSGGRDAQYAHLYYSRSDDKYGSYLSYRTAVEIGNN